MKLHLITRRPSPFRPGDWFVHFQGQSETAFAPWLADPRIEKHRVGDFIVGPVPPESR